MDFHRKQHFEKSRSKNEPPKRRRRHCDGSKRLLLKDQNQGRGSGHGTHGFAQGRVLRAGQRQDHHGVHCRCQAYQSHQERRPGCWCRLVSSHPLCGRVGRQYMCGDGHELLIRYECRQVKCVRTFCPKHQQQLLIHSL